MAKRKNGEGTWGTKKINGKEYKFYRDPNGKYFYGKTEKEIKQKRKEYEIKQEQTILDTSSLLSDYVSSYLNTKKLEIESTTFDSYEDAIANMLKAYTIGNCTLSVINEDNMRLYVNELAQKYSKASIDKLFKILKPALRYAVEHNHIAKNPLDYIKVPSENHVAVKKKEVPYIIEEDLNKLYEESKRTNTQRTKYNGIIGTPVYGSNAQVVILIGHTGLRISEAIGLKWEDVDVKNKRIYVKNALVRVRDREGTTGKKYTTKLKNPKSKAGEREIPLSDIALEMIEFFDKQFPEHKPNDFVILNSKGKSPIPRNVTKTLDSMLIRSGCSIDHCGLHGLRHGFGAILLSNGVDIKIVSKLLGHEKISTTYDIYIDFTREQVENSVISVLNKK